MSFAEDSSKRRYMNAKVVFLHDRVRPYVGQRQPGTRQQALLRKESKRTERMHQIADAVPL
jgi:hypothetical protein